LVRNTCIAISYLNQRLDFGRNSVVMYCFSEYNFNVSLEEYKVFSRMLKDTILLNSYKDKITKEDMLNPVSLKSIYSNEEYAIYKKMLKTYID